MDWILNIASSFFSKKIKDYKEKVEKLRNILDEFNKYCESIIRVETDEELLKRAKETLKKIEEGHRLVVRDGSLLPAIKRLVNEIKLIQKTLWFRLLKRFKLKI